MERFPAIHVMCALVISGALVAACSAGINVTKAEPEKTASGLVYYLPKTQLNVQPQPDGTITAAFEFVPDEENAYAIEHWSHMSKHKFNPTLTKRGFLKKVQWDGDTTAVAKKVAEVAGDAGNKMIEALNEREAEQEKKDEEDLGSAETAVRNAIGAKETADENLLTEERIRRALDVDRQNMGYVPTMTLEESLILNRQSWELQRAINDLAARLTPLKADDPKRPGLEAEKKAKEDEKAEIDYRVKVASENGSKVLTLEKKVVTSDEKLMDLQRKRDEAAEDLAHALEKLRALRPDHELLAEGMTALEGSDEDLMNRLMNQPVPSSEFPNVPGGALFEIREGFHPEDLHLLPDRRRRIVRLHGVGEPDGIEGQLDFPTATPPAIPAPRPDLKKVRVSAVGGTEVTSPLRAAALYALKDAESEKLIDLKVKQERKKNEEPDLDISTYVAAHLKAQGKAARAEKRAKKQHIRISFLVSGSLKEVKTKECLLFLVKRDDDTDPDNGPLLPGKGEDKALRVSVAVQRTVAKNTFVAFAPPSLPSGIYELRVKVLAIKKSDKQQGHQVHGVGAKKSSSNKSGTKLVPETHNIELRVN